MPGGLINNIMEEDIQNLKKRIEDLERVQREHVLTTKDIVLALSKFLNIFQKFSKNFSIIILFILAAIYREEIVYLTKLKAKEISKYWHSFSENWQIAFFSILMMAIISIISIYLDRKWRR